MQMQMPKSKWFVSGFAVSLGLVYLAVQWANDDPGGGLVSLAIMVAFAAALVAFSGRSGVAEVMCNPRADERSAMPRPAGDGLRRARDHHRGHRGGVLRARTRR